MAESAMPVAGPFRVRLLNFAASFFFASLAYVAYQFSPHTEGLRTFTNQQLEISGAQALAGAYGIYSLILLVFYFSERHPGTSKSIDALRAIKAIVFSRVDVLRHGLPRPLRLGLLTVMVKCFFAPIMLLSLFEFSSAMFSNGHYLFRHANDFQDNFLAIFNSHGFWFLFQLILLVDVFFFTIGYLVEHPALKNEIRSVDATLIGWIVVLACYPPFNQITARIIGGNIADFPQFETPVIHVAVNVLLLILLAVFSWASLALNLKASNLTHRGIVSRGPYRFVRHPAYTAKCLTWWLGAFPALFAAWNHSAWSLVLVSSGVVGWTALYVLRAMTEETHLRGVDGEYDAYSRKVRYRFIPGLC